MTGINIFLDNFLINFYQITGNPITNFFLGTFFISILGVLVGEISIFMASKINKTHLKKINDDLAENYRLSENAARTGKPSEFKAYNNLANEAFGKVFFNMIALSASRLWPIFFILSWMQYRFHNIDFLIPVKLPLVGDLVSYTFIFLLCYILSYSLIQKIKIY